MSDERKPINILMAEDDDDDFFLTQEALQSSKLINPLIRVKDGEELLHYLRGTGPYENDDNRVSPSVVLLDLNMPKKDGREALEEMKKDPKLNMIPVVVLTTSRAQEDIINSYQLGVSSFIRKPVQFGELVDILKAFKRYWLEIVELPPVNLD